MIDNGRVYRCMLGHKWVIVNVVRDMITGEVCVVKAPIGMINVPELHVIVPEQFFIEAYQTCERIQ